MIITYGGVEITKYLRPTRGLDRKILPETDHRLEKIGRTDGYYHLGTVFGMRTISMPFRITNDLIKNRRELARVLSTREPLPLVFSDEPDKCWFALPSGDISLDEIVILGHGVIEWIVPDGVAHSLEPRVFTNTIVPSSEGNQVPDPEYKNKDKYYKVWTAIDNVLNGTSKVLMAKLLEEYTIVDKGNYKVNGLYIMQNELSVSRPYPSMKKGDLVSVGVQINIVENLSSETPSLFLQELDGNGGSVIATHEVKASNSLGSWQTLKREGIKITSERTKALRLLVGMPFLSHIQMSNSQFNLGGTLKPYEATTETHSEYIAVTNNGTYKAWPIFRATMRSENGLLGLLNQNEGILQLGNAEDFDTITGIRNDKVVNMLMRKSDGDNLKFEYNSPKAKPDYPNFMNDPSTPNSFIGEIDWDYYPDSCRPKFAVNDKDNWGGPTMYLPIPANYANKRNGGFRWANRLNFLTDKNQQGRMTFTLQNSEGPVLGFVIRDSSSTAANLIIEFWVQGKWVKTFNLDKKEWTGNFWEYSVTKSNGTNVEFKFSKWKAFSGEGIISSKDIIFNINEPSLANTDIEAMTVWFAQARKVPTGLQDWTDNRFWWINEGEQINIPNAFNEGDIVEIDVKNRVVYLNGVENNYLHAIGNKWGRFAVEPGTTSILPVCSTWARMFDLEVFLRGAYI